MQPKMTRRRLVGSLGLMAASLALVLGLSACGAAPAADKGSEPAAKAETVTFTDSAGREVEIPAEVERIAPSGHMATQVLITVAPDKLVGLSQELDDDQLVYLGDRVPADLPVLGAAFGSKGDLNKEALAATGAQMVIDAGEFKEGMVEELDALQGQLGIPVVFIEADLDSWPDAYRMLGELLGVEERAEELAEYCEDASAEVDRVLEAVPEAERPSVLYCTGATGTNVVAKGSFQANVIDMLANNAAVIDAPSGKGNGTESSIEQIAAWNPDVILFGPDSPYAEVAADEVWKTVPAIAAGNYHKVPTVPYCWLNFPSSVNQVLGMEWLAHVLYPDQFEDGADAFDVAREYYEVFYGHDLTQGEYDGLVG